MISIYWHNKRPSQILWANKYDLHHSEMDRAERQDMMYNLFKHPTHYLLRLLYNMNSSLNAILVVISYVE